MEQIRVDDSGAFDVIIESDSLKAIAEALNRIAIALEMLTERRPNE